MNYLSGLLPPSLGLLSNLKTLSLGANQFSGTIPVELSNCNHLQDILLGRNNLVGSIPAIMLDIPTLVNLDLSFNRLNGTIPSINRLVSVQLGSNQLEGTIPRLASRIHTIDVSKNNLNGSLEDVLTGRFDHLSTFSVASNRLRGTIPPNLGIFYPSLYSFDISDNALNGNIPSFSENNFSSALVDVRLARNAFFGDAFAPFQNLISLRSLDISKNYLTAQLYEGMFGLSRSLTTVLASNNLIEGDPTPLFNVLTTLDLSNNNISFDMMNIAKRKQFFPIVTFLARGNRLHGSFRLANFPLIQTLDLSLNALDRDISIEDLVIAFKQQLSSLDLSENPEIPPLKSLEGTSMTDMGYPMKEGLLTCTHLTMGPDSTFRYDASLFSYLQCNCTEGTYGSPPGDCLGCPELASCQPDRTVAIPQNVFAYGCANNNHEMDEFTPFSIISMAKIDVEPCSPPALSQWSPCIGVSIYVHRNGSMTTKTSQCAEGTEGRLCSKCICDDIRGCFYPSGPSCKKCRFVLSPHQIWPLVLGIAVIALAVLSTIMFFVLRSKRLLDTRQWEELPILSRFVYRVRYATTLGYITIMVQFAQFTAEFSNWNELVQTGWLKLLNGNPEGLGLPCLFPFLSNPTYRLMTTIGIPFVVVIFFIISILLADFVLRRIYHKHCNSGSQSSYEDSIPSPIDTSSNVNTSTDHESEEYIAPGQFDSTPLLADYRSSSSFSNAINPSNKSSHRKIVQHYPTLAVISSMSISIIQFFYFGAAMTVTEYLFCYNQECTGIDFVQTQPWMRCDSPQVKTLRQISIPFLLFYFLGLPAAFVAVAFRIRHVIPSYAVTLYGGTLFDRYRLKWYWWEIMVVMRKLALAFVLKSISNRSSFQPATIFFILTLSGFLQHVMRPRREDLENIIEPLATAILVANYGARLGLLYLGNSASQSYLALQILSLLLSAGFIIVATSACIYQTVTGKPPYNKQVQM
jgi:Leucine-rich repeat (LRR) protein